MEHFNFRQGSPQRMKIPASEKTDLTPDSLEPTALLEDVESFACRWPYAEARCCGRPTVRLATGAFSPYCTEHSARAYKSFQKLPDLSELL